MTGKKGIGRRPSTIVDVGETLHVLTTQGPVAIVDGADRAVVDGYAWQAKVTSGTTYLYRKERSENGTSRLVFLHRAILAPPDAMLVDHIDRDGLNNRRSNLRVCTHAENSANKSPHLMAKTGIVGAYQQGGVFYSRIVIAGKRHHLGYFKTAEEAGEAYRQARKVAPTFFSKQLG